MKKFFKLFLSSVMLFSLMVTPLKTNALYIANDNSDIPQDKIIHDEAIVVVKDEQDNIVDRFLIEITDNSSNVNITKVNSDFDTSKILDTIVIFDGSACVLYLDYDNSYAPLVYHYVEDSDFTVLSNLIEKDNDTVGNSDDTTVGNSNNLYDEPTNIRGDVNYDGKVNVIDVMTLRRYLLHLLEW